MMKFLQVNQSFPSILRLTYFKFHVSYHFGNRQLEFRLLYSLNYSHVILIRLFNSTNEMQKVCCQMKRCISIYGGFD